MKPKYDLIIVGAGIVGAASAYKAALTFPNKKILLVEKEQQAASHQTGRNSGVIHAGVYYEPGSLKARYCKAGLRATIAFCQEHKLPFLQCGKLIVATDELEQARLDSLFERCKHNELDIQRLSSQGITRAEPNIVGKEALLVNDTGITDYQKITQTMLTLFAELGGEVCYGQRVNSLQEEGDKVVVKTSELTLVTRFLLNCTGLMSDRLIKMMGLEPGFQIIPFKGEYFRLSSRWDQVVNHLIYPVPDPAMPFLGVHLTRMIDGCVTVGPNAVLAMGREGYGKMQVNSRDLAEMIASKGFWKLLWQHKRSATFEIKNSLSRQGYLQLVQKYCPKISLQDLQPHPSGIRAQAVSSDGQLIHDFKFVESDNSLHVGNAPSPAATSAIPIAENIIAKIKEKLT